MTPLILTFTNPSVFGVINEFSRTGSTKKRAKGMVGFLIHQPCLLIIGICTGREMRLVGSSNSTSIKYDRK